MAKKNALKVISVIVAFYLLAEPLLYVLNIPKIYRPHSLPAQFLRVKNDDFVYVSTPSTSIEITYNGNPRKYFHADNTVQHVTNGYGFRGPLFFFQKPTGTKRVLFFGDSFTFGQGVYFEDTYPQQFAKKTEFETINLAVPGYNVKQEAALLKSFKHQLGENAVVLGINLSDAEANLFIPDATLPEGMYRRRNPLADDLEPMLLDPPWFFRISRLNRIIWQYALGYVLSLKTIAYYKGLYVKDDPDWQNERKALAEFAEYGKKNRIPVIIIIFPLLYRLDNYPFRDIHDLLHQELKGLGLPYIDLLEELKQYKGFELWVHPTDSHPNEIVNRIAAEVLVKKLSEMTK